MEAPTPSRRHLSRVSSQRRANALAFFFARALVVTLDFPHIFSPPSGKRRSLQKEKSCNPRS